MSAGTFVDLLNDSESVIHFEDGSSLTAQGLAARGAALAGALSDIIQPGSRVAIWLQAGRPYLEVLAACAAGGFTAVNVNTRYSSAEALDLVSRSGSAVIVTDQSISASGDQKILAGRQVLEAVGQPPRYRPSPRDRFLVFTTSGTTSKPKMVLHLQDSIVRHSLDVARHIKLGQHLPVLIALPMCGVFGLTSFTAAIAGNCPVWLTADFNPNTVGSIIERQQIAVMNGSDDMFHRLLLTDYDVSSLTIAGFASFNTSLENVAQAAETRGARLSGVYGMSEVQALYSIRDQRLDLPDRAAAGGTLVSAEAEVRVVDPESGAGLGHGIDGEIHLKGPSLFAGYLAEGGAVLDEKLTSTAHVDGWFKTGDLGATHKDGTFSFITRKGDVLRVGGFLVAPTEIEEVILQLDSVSDVQVVAVSSKSGSRPVAFVIGNPHGSDVDESFIIAHCRSRLAKFKCPVMVIEVDSFPTTDGPNGVKIQRAKLRDMAQTRWESGHQRYVQRTGLPGDAETIAAYHHQCRLKAFAPILPERALDGYPADGSLPRWKQWLADDSDLQVNVIEFEGQAVGHVVVHQNELMHLFVDPNHWGQGLGRRLLEIGEQMLTEAGHSHIQLHTMVGNTPAISLYKSAGWIVTDELTEDEINGYTYYEHLLTKDLRSTDSTHDT